jgi:hypothetical protein
VLSIEENRTHTDRDEQEREKIQNRSVEQQAGHDAGLEKQVEGSKNDAGSGCLGSVERLAPGHPCFEDQQRRVERQQSYDPGGMLQVWQPEQAAQHDSQMDQAYTDRAHRFASLRDQTPSGARPWRKA